MSGTGPEPSAVASDGIQRSSALTEYVVEHHTANAAGLQIGPVSASRRGIWADVAVDRFPASQLRDGCYLCDP
jgi:hypothetical protein